jgi:zinc D-Ala-D-Ala carboxypeptidase
VSEAFDIPADYAANRHLTHHFEATELVEVGSASEGRAIRLAPETAAAWKRMQDAASREGIAFLAISGFRSIERQTEIIQRKLLAGESLEAVLQTMAAPGFSEHHTGRAIDIGVPDEPPLTEAFALTPAFRWLTAQAAHFGFRLSYPRDNPQGLVYEPWHWYHHTSK